MGRSAKRRTNGVIVGHTQDMIESYLHDARVNVHVSSPNMYFFDNPSNKSRKRYQCCAILSNTVLFMTIFLEFMFCYKYQIFLCKRALLPDVDGVGGGVLGLLQTASTPAPDADPHLWCGVSTLPAVSPLPTHQSAPPGGSGTEPLAAESGPGCLIGFYCHTFVCKFNPKWLKFTGNSSDSFS